VSNCEDNSKNRGAYHTLVMINRARLIALDKPQSKNIRDDINQIFTDFDIFMNKYGEVVFELSAPIELT